MRLALLLTLCCLTTAPSAIAAPETSSWVAKRKKKRKKRRKRRARKVRKKATPKKAKRKAPTPPKAKTKRKPTTPPKANPEKQAPPAITTTAAVDAPEDKRPNVAVLPFQAVHGVEQSVANLLSEILLTQVGNAPYFSRVIGGSDMQELLDLEQQKVALGCDDDSCLSSLGGALGVALMVAPSIGKLGDQYILNLKLTDVEEAIVRARLNVEIEGERNLKADLEAAIDELLQVAFEPKSSASSADPPKPEASTQEPPLATTTAPGHLPSLGLGLMGLGLVSSAGAYYLQQQTHANFNASPGTLADYDRGLEGTYYANLSLGVGLTTLVGGTMTWWLTR